MNCKDCIHVKVCGEYVAGLAAARGVIIDNQAELEEILDVTIVSTSKIAPGSKSCRVRWEIQCIISTMWERFIHKE